MENLKEMVNKIIQNRKEIARLQGEQKALRSQVLEHMNNHGIENMEIQMPNESFLISRRENTVVLYDDSLLRQRLGDEHYCQIASVDLKKVRDHSHDLPSWLGPNAHRVMSVNRQKVKGAIANGQLSAKDFHGTFNKQMRPYIIIRQKKGNWD